jgi:hypothetical protein
VSRRHPNCGIAPDDERDLRGFFDPAGYSTRIPSNLNTGVWTSADQTSSNQLVVAYGRGRSTRVYTTAYSLRSGQLALRRCIAAHGPDVFARLVPAARSVA